LRGGDVAAADHKMAGIAGRQAQLVADNGGRRTRRNPAHGETPPGADLDRSAPARGSAAFCAVLARCVVADASPRTPGEP